MRKWNRIILSLIVSAILLTSCGTSQDNLKDTQENYFWGADKGCAAIADINLGIVPQEIADKVYKAQEMIISGEIDVFSGELRDNQGNVVVPKGETMSDGQMMDMGFLLDNVIGTLP